MAFPPNIFILNYADQDLPARVLRIELLYYVFFIFKQLFPLPHLRLKGESPMKLPPRRRELDRLLRNLHVTPPPSSSLSLLLSSLV